MSIIWLQRGRYSSSYLRLDQIQFVNYAFKNDFLMKTAENSCRSFIYSSHQFAADSGSVFFSNIFVSQFDHWYLCALRSDLWLMASTRTRKKNMNCRKNSFLNRSDRTIKKYGRSKSSGNDAANKHNSWNGNSKFRSTGEVWLFLQLHRLRFVFFFCSVRLSLTFTLRWFFIPYHCAVSYFEYAINLVDHDFLSFFSAFIHCCGYCCAFECVVVVNK